MLDHRCCDAPSQAVQRLCAVQVNRRCGGESGSEEGSCCCFAYCYVRGCVRCSSRDVAINTCFAGHADYLGACFHSRAPIPVNNRQSPVLPHALLLPQLLVVISVICPPGPTNGSSILELAICCSSCQPASRPFTAYRSCPCSAFSVQPQRPP
jgi:hypothetical protein